MKLTQLILFTIFLSSTLLGLTENQAHAESFTIHLKQKNNRFMNCKGHGKSRDKFMVGLASNESPKSLKLNGRNYKIVRVDPSSNGKGYLMMARSGSKFVKFIGTRRDVDRLRTQVYVGVRSEKKNKDVVTGSFPLVCDMNPS